MMHEAERYQPVRSILVPTDFSENAGTALKWAVERAHAHGAPITLLHVAQVTSMKGPPLAIQEKIAQSLEMLVQTVRESGVEVASIQRAGRPWEIISAEAQEHDLVVIGARGQTPHTVRILGIGSTADRVLRTSTVPVLTVHLEDAPAEHRPRKVVIPTDFSDPASLALPAVERVFGAESDAGLDITLLHAFQPLIEYADMYAAIPAPSGYVATEEEAMEMLQALAGEVRSTSVSVTPTMRQGHPVNVIVDEAKAIDADLIAMGTHGRSGLARLMLGSVAERVVHWAGCPVLAVGPATAGERGERSSQTKTARAVIGSAGSSQQ